MGISFRNEANIVMWVFARHIENFHHLQYVFASQCVWWLSALIWLSQVLVFYLKHQQFPSELVILNDCGYNEIVLAP